MDIKEFDVLQRCYKKIINETFDEDDIFLLIILIRDNFKNGTWLKEFGDLIAHRVRDRGKVFNNLKSVYESYLMKPYDEWSSEQIIAPKVACDFSGIYFNEYFTEINHFFSSQGFAEISVTIAEDILLCIFSLLQFSKYEEKGNTYGTLNVFLLKDEISINTYMGSDKSMVCMGKINNRYMYLNDEETKNFFKHCHKPISIIRTNKKELLIKYDD